MPANACLHTGDSRKRPTQFPPRPLYRAPTPPLSRPCVLTTAFVRAVAFGQDRGQDRGPSRDALRARKSRLLYPRPGRLGRMPACAKAQRADPVPAEVPMVPLLGYLQKHGQRSFNRPQALRNNALPILRKSHPQVKLAPAPSTPLGQRWTGTGSQAGLTAREAARALLQLGADPARVALGARHLNQRRDEEHRRNASLQKKGDLHAGDRPAAGRTRTDLSQGSGQGLNHRIVHRNTNHLFDEGIKDVAGKSYDSRP